MTGTLLAGSIGGMLLARTFSATLGEHLGWRAPYLAAGVLTLLLATVLAFTAPATPPPARRPYPALPAESLRLLRTEPDLRRSCLYQASVFAGFSAVWACLALLLTGPAYRLDAQAVGMLALVGGATMLCTPLAGRLADRLDSAQLPRGNTPGGDPRPQPANPLLDIMSLIEQTSSSARGAGSGRHHWRLVRQETLQPPMLIERPGARPPTRNEMSSPADMMRAVTPWTLLDIDRALRESWAADTCSPDDLERAGWSPENPAWGHCDVTALVVNDLLGGDLVVGKVYAVNGEQQGHHCWNRLANGIEIDLTREQFRDGQKITDARVLERPGPQPRRRRREYELLRSRVAAHLGPLPAPGSA